ncbi:MAG: aromatic amino acid transport family protein, partial [Nanoarchaeota archaeon]|nr:aromatic amino acid transport family protein [Nanoarchaeota archaeon]
MANKLYVAVATMIGYIIGAGILGIPYAVAKSGLVIGLLSIIILGVAVICLNLYMGEIVLRTKAKHQIPGYAQKYLGNYGRWIMIILMIFGAYGALIAYIIKEGQFLSALFTPIFGGGAVFYSILFFIMASYLIYAGIEAISKSEFFFVSLILFLIVIFFIASFGSISLENVLTFNPGAFLIPFGVILFAFHGLGSISEIGVELRRHRKLMKKAIILGSVLPIVIYVVFTALVVGITGTATTDGAILGVAEKIGSNVLLFGAIFGILVLATSFIGVGLALKEMYMFDFKMKPWLASFLTCIIPLLLFFAIIYKDVHNAFYNVIDITGSIVVPLETIFVLLIVR